MSKVEWNDKLVIDHVQNVTQENMNKAVILLEGAYKRLLSKRGQGTPYKRGGKTAWRSLPGDPPAKDTGILANSITHDVRVESDGIHGYAGSDEDYIKSKSAGTDVNYGFYLEVGTKRIDPRPWLIKTRNKLLPKILKILKGEI